MEELKKNRDVRDRLLKIFALVFGSSPDGSAPGPDDNFFSLGGDSFKASEIIGKAREAGLEISVANLMTYPTPALLAQALVESGASRLESVSSEVANGPLVKCAARNAPSKRSRPDPGELLALAAQRGIELRLAGTELSFWAPKGAMSDELRTMLSEQKAEIIARLKARTPDDSSTPIVAAEHDSDCVSLAQEQLWLLDRIAPGSAWYHLTYSVRMRGPLDRAALQNSLLEIVRRHIVLRSTFPEIDGAPKLLVRPPSLDWEFVSLLYMPIEDREPELENLSRTLGREPFDLARGPLLRARLIGLGDDDHELVIVQHHIATDGWSGAVLFDELAELYSAFANGNRSVSLPALSVQYADFARWQRQRITAGALRRTEDWWRDRLRDLPPLNLPFDRPTPARRTPRGADFLFALPPDLAAALRELSRREGVSLFITLLTAFACVLHRNTGQVDFGIGTIIAGRHRSELQRLIGCFINTLVLRIDLSGDPTFATAIDRAKKLFADALDHQDLPFSHVVRCAGAPREKELNPLVRANFLLQNQPPRRRDFAGLTCNLRKSTPDASVGGTAKFDLSLILEDKPDGGLSGDMQYSTDVFDAPTVERLVGHLETLLRGATEDPQRRLSELAVLTERERALLATWNHTRVEYPRAACVHHLFEAQVEKSPQVVAAVFEDQTVTYAELNAKANRLAQRLAACGVRPDALVAICMERSLDMLVAALGVHKAGGAYVPIDPSYPSSRIAMMLDEAHPYVVLTQRPLLERIPATRAEVLCVASAEMPSEDIENTKNEANSENLAYVIFTSGSTGRPNGVQIPHRAVVNFLHAMRREPGLRAADKLLALTTFSFDIAGLELLLPLTVGAQVEIVRHDVAANGDALRERIRAARPSVIQATPATWSLLLDVGWEGAPELKILCGGEPLSPQLALALLPRCGSLWNMYGPTETTIWSAIDRVTSTDRISIGRPIANTRIYVLDSALKPVPLGVPGEIYIAGDGLARGYLNRADLTAQRFVPDPVSGEPGERMYRTGDLGRYLPDGRLEHLGRIDHQVKIRGVRIELGEVETRLSEHADIRAAIVVAREDTLGDRRLVAYVIPTTPRDGLEANLRAFLAERLPPAMLPSTFVSIQEFPLTPNGKVDRTALPAPGRASSASRETYLAPRTNIEETVAAIWAEALGVDRVGVDDNFFDIGGHSLLLAKVRARLRQRLGVEVSLTHMFEHPTVRRISARIAGGSPRAEEQGRTRAATPSGATDDAFAIVGLSCRFPGASNADEFWSNLRNGIESITRFSDEELRACGVDDFTLANANYVKARPVLNDVGQFDAAFFGMSPREAAVTDPTHRLFLECAWEALEASGYAPHSAGRVGVYAGAGPAYYAERSVHPNRDQYGRREVMTGNLPDYIATRVSYKLNLTGPSVNVQTACSTSLVATILACQSLRHHECEMALAGGAAVYPYRSGYLYQDGEVASPDGHCRAFDADARGAVFGDGVGVVVLKRLADAMEQGDRILAVIRGFGLNNDGSDKIGYTAPSIPGQAEVIREAFAMGGVDPETVSYVEAHGTATIQGDPIEVAALTKAFRERTERKAFCAIGSVKTNVGHLDTAAGIAGLIKTVLSLQAREIPPSLHFKHPNPQIDFANSPFYVNTTLSEWKSRGPRRAGVSSFGIGGTNAHVIVEEAPELPARRGGEGGERPAHLMVLSAKREIALAQQVAHYAEHLGAHPELAVEDVCHTAGVGRTHFEHRLAVVASSRAELVEGLRSLERADAVPGCVRGRAQATPPRIAFLFPGQGSQYVGMGRGLYETQPVFKRALDECAQLLERELDRPLLSLLYGGEGGESVLERTCNAQPALFAIAYAVAELWRSWGVAPDAVMGHSVGELAAACVAGVFSLEDGLRLVAARGRLMQRLPAGGIMMAVRASEDRVRAALAPYVRSVAVAALNAPDQLVVSGAEADVLAVTAALSKEGVDTKRLHVSHAFHSPLMAPVLEEFRRAAESVRYALPRIALYENVGGACATDQVATPEYWVRHVMAPVRFADGVSAMAEAGISVFLDVGPRPTLSTLAEACLPDTTAAFLPSLPSRKDGEAWPTILSSLAELYVKGVRVDFQGFDAPYSRRRVALPTYPFQRDRHWIDPRSSSRRTGRAGHVLLGERVPFAGETAVFENELSAETVELQRLGAGGVVRAGGLLGIAWASAEALFGKGDHALSNVELKEPLVMPEVGVRTTQVHVGEPKEGEASLALYSRSDGSAGNTFSLHLTGRLVRDGGTRRKSGSVVLEAVRQRCKRVESLPRGRRIRDLWKGSHEMLARLELPEEGGRSALLDAALGALAFAVDADLSFDAKSVELVSIGETAGEVWAHAQLGNVSPDAKTAGGEVVLCDAKGVVLGGLLGVCLQHVPEALGSSLWEHGSSGDKEEQSVESVVRSLIAQITRATRDSVAPDAALKDLGLDSLMWMRLRNGIRHALGVIVPLPSLTSASTLQELTRLIEVEFESAGPDTQHDQEIPRLSREEVNPLLLPTSFAQDRLWFLDQLHPGGWAYNIPVVLRLEGKLDPVALEKAFVHLARRHETLRTTFASRGGAPLQAIDEATELRLALADWTSRSDTGSDLQEELERQIREPFDLTRGPLLRVKLLRLRAETHVLALTMHHIISDGWSINVLLRELSTLYRALSRGEAVSLPELPIQYADYAQWERASLAGSVLDAHLRYWTDHLAGMPTVLELPTDHPRPPVQSERGSCVNFSLGEDLTAAIKQLGSREDVTLFMMLFSALGTLLSRWSGETDIAIGTRLANRPTVQTEALIGYFANTLPLRLDLSGDPTFSDLLQQVKRVALDAYEHQSLPFELLVKEIQPTRDLSRSPLVQVHFILQEVSLGFELPGIQVSQVPHGQVSARFDLTLQVSSGPSGLVGQVQYNADLFQRASIERVVGDWRGILEAASANPLRRISELGLNAEHDDSADRGRLVDVPDVVDRVFAHAGRSPAATAIYCEGQRLTFGELRTGALAVVDQLRGLPRATDTVVGLLMDRERDLPAAIFGILASGAAYLPLDPSYPPDRLSFMLRDAGAKAIVTTETLVERLPRAEIPTFVLRGVRSDPHALPAAPAADALAYVMYTSGSTGNPKGVLVTRRAVASYTKALGDSLGISHTDIYAHTASISFSSSVRQMMLPLSYGASVLLASRDDLREPLRLLERVGTIGATILDLVPSYWRAMVDALLSAPPDVRRRLLTNRVRLLLSASEVLTADVPRAWRELGHPARLVNMYGQTETTGIVSVYPIPDELPADGRHLPIGKPLAHASVEILDRDLRPVPTGVFGELCVGGAALARGYTGDLQVTAEKFVQTASPPRRVYRTGDRARRLPDGHLEFYGRVDEQIKVRGMRVEPKEVEAAIRKHARVTDCVVVLKELPRVGGTLIAYVVEQERSVLAEDDLRSRLRRDLPEHMVPAHFVVMDRLPRTASGKIDKHRLQAPERTSHEASYVAPRDGTEATLARIWADVLNLERVSVSTSFFDLGGHSMLAAQLVSRVRSVFGRHVPLRWLFEAGTVTRFAEKLDEEPNVGEPLGHGVVLLREGNDSTVPVLAHPTSGDLFCYSKLVPLLGDRRVLGLSARDLGDPPATSVEAIVARYVEPLRKASAESMLVLIGWSFGGLIALEAARELAARGAPAPRVVLLDSHLSPPPENVDAELFMSGLIRDIHGTGAGPSSRRDRDRTGRSSEAQLEDLFRAAKTAEKVPADLRWEDVLERFRLFRAHRAAFTSYAPTRYQGELVLVRAAEGIGNPDEWLAIANSLRVIDVGGDHHSILREPHVRETAAALTTLCNTIS